jgi:hypothetical protein
LISRTPNQTLATRSRRLGRSLALVAGAALALAAAPAMAGNGGTGVPPPPPPTVAGAKAKLVDGLAVAPSSAPKRVKGVIAAANKIAKGHGYCNGGGYASWQSPCYDCSSSVSFALHGGGLIDRAMPPTSLEGWGRPDRGKWITVYANSGHAYMKVAGLRFDTADVRGIGPGWAKGMGWERTQTAVARHKSGF